MSIDLVRTVYIKEKIAKTKEKLSAMLVKFCFKVSSFKK